MCVIIQEFGGVLKTTKEVKVVPGLGSIQLSIKLKNKRNLFLVFCQDPDIDPYYFCC